MKYELPGQTKKRDRLLIGRYYPSGHEVLISILLGSGDGQSQRIEDLGPGLDMEVSLLYKGFRRR
jgi:hypothetical protein